MSFFFKLIIFLILFLSSNSLILAKEISGFAYITDGDTIKILKKKIRLHGIDTPEKNQKCIKNFKEYYCGQVATDALIKKIGKNLVTCKLQDKLDRYKRYIGICFIQDIELNSWLVKNGYAVAYRRYSKDYINEENYAKKNKLGLWSGTFIHPEKWRKLN